MGSHLPADLARGSESDAGLSLDGESEKSSFIRKWETCAELPMVGEDGAIDVVDVASEDKVVRGRDEERLGESDGVMRPSGT